MEIKYCLEKANLANESLWHLTYKCKAWKEDAKTILYVVGYAVIKLSSHIMSIRRNKGNQVPKTTLVQHRSKQNLESLFIIQNL